MNIADFGEMEVLIDEIIVWNSAANDHMPCKVYKDKASHVLFEVCGDSWYRVSFIDEHGELGFGPWRRIT